MMKDIRQFMNLMCIKAGGNFKLGEVYAGVCRKGDVWVYGHVLMGHEMRIIEAITVPYSGGIYDLSNDMNEDIVWTPSDNSIAFVKCEVLPNSSKVEIDLEAIYATNGDDEK